MVQALRAIVHARDSADTCNSDHGTSLQ